MPVLLIGIAYVLGISLGLVFPADNIVTIIACMSVFVAMITNFVWGNKFAFWVVVGALVLGWVRTPQSEENPSVKMPTPPCARIIEGIVSEVPVELADRVRLTIDMERCSPCLKGKGGELDTNVKGRLYVTWLTDVPATILKGDRVRFIAEASPVTFHSNFGSRLRASPSHAYSAVIFRKDALVLNGHARLSLVGLFQPLRTRLSKFWRGAISESEARLARALLLGESQALTSIQREHFRLSGVAHLLAVSGLHLGIAALFVFSLLKLGLLRFTWFSRRFDSGQFAAFMTIFAVIGFTLLTGARPPVVRACVMAVSVLMARSISRPRSPLEAVSLAAVAMLVYDPTNLKSPGFQLSFGAVLAFLVALKPVGNKIMGLVMASIAAFAATAPLVLFHFGRVSLVGIPMNVVLIPLISLLVLPGLLTVSLLGLILPAAGEIAAVPIEWILHFLDLFLGLISQFPVTVENTDGIFFTGALCLCIAALLFTAGRRKMSAYVIIPALALLIASAVTQRPSCKSGLLTVDFLDVGQGDSTLVTFPDGERWLFDAGGTASKPIGERHIIPALRGLGVRSIQTLVLTHPDPDHVMGMPAVVRELPVGRIWDNGQGKEEGAHESYKELLALARQKHIPVLGPSEFCGDTQVGDVLVSAVHPCSPDRYDPGLSFNDNSIVVRLSLGDTSVLLTGDLSKMGEEALLEKGVIKPTDVLKLGHHGSNSSSSARFLDALKPYWGVASCARWNKYGMPATSVQHRLQERKIRLFRTDHQGGIRAQLSRFTIHIFAKHPQDYP